MASKNLKRFIFPSIVGLVVAYNIGSHFYAGYKKRDATTFYGNIEIREVNLGFKVSGYVEKAFFEEGSFVKKGDLMATLDPVLYRRSLDLAEANMRAAESDYKNANAILERNTELYKKGYISSQEYETMETTAESLKNRWISQQKQFMLSKENLAYVNLYAPSDGIVVTRVLEPGSVVDVGQTVYTILLSDTAEARGYISELALTKIEYGMPVVIETDAGGSYEGKITFISPKAEFTPKNVETQDLKSDLVYRFKATATKPDNKLKQGMPVTIKVLRHKKND